jgi:hypothetical protein
MVRKKGEGGFYLYLKRQSEGTWMNSKCQIQANEQISMSGAPSLGFWSRIGEVEGCGPHISELLG